LRIHKGKVCIYSHSGNYKTNDLCRAIEVKESGYYNWNKRKINEKINMEIIEKIVYLALKNASKKWTMPIKNWPLALNQFEILCGDSGYDLVTKII
jgi:hypothetical protein